MAVNKSETRKKRLVKAAQLNRRVPIFAIAKTNRRVSVNRFARNWRSQKLGLKEE